MGGLGVTPLFGGLNYNYVLDGPWKEVADPKKKLKATVTEGPWIASFWVGCWDADALCGYIKGTLTL